MTQFDLYLNPDTASRKRYPYLIVLQHDVLQDLDSVIVAPLRLLNSHRSATLSNLNPVVSFSDKHYAIRIHELAAMIKRSLSRPVGNLADHRLAIVAALDLLFTGF